MVFLVALILLIFWTSFNLKSKPRTEYRKDPKTGSTQRRTYYSTDSEELHKRRSK